MFGVGLGSTPPIGVLRALLRPPPPSDGVRFWVGAVMCFLSDAGADRVVVQQGLDGGGHQGPVLRWYLLPGHGAGLAGGVAIVRGQRFVGLMERAGDVVGLGHGRASPALAQNMTSSSLVMASAFSRPSGTIVSS